MLPASALPTFKLPRDRDPAPRRADLAEHFVYVNDDVFLGRPRRPEHFFAPGGQYAAFVADHRAVGLPGTTTAPTSRPHRTTAACWPMPSGWR